MFDETMVVAALIMNRARNEETADRRAFYGPDAQPEVVQAQPKRTRLPRFLRRPTPVV